VSAHDDVAAWLAARADRVIETSCAQIFLEGDVAWKMKRPVDFGFLDYSTLAKRKAFLEKELAFNNAITPGIYRAVRKVARAGDGFAFDGPGRAADYVLEMRRFADTAVLADNPGRIDSDIAERLGRTIAQFHIRAPVNPNGGGVKALGFTIRSNAEQLRRMADRLGPDDVEALLAITDHAFEAAGPHLERRRAEGFARHCHGDLHLANIIVEDGVPKLFDCIEFNELLSEIDVQYDLAFTLMDLAFRGRPDAANRVLGAYLDDAARHFGDELWAGLSLLPMMQGVRASVRAHVVTQQGDVAGGRAYVAAARRHFAPPKPTLTAIGGVSGAGKTTVARMIAHALGPTPGAILLRSDEVRKRVFGYGLAEPAPDALYAPESMRQAYAAMLAEAKLALTAGRSVILDATFIDLDNRTAAAALAKEVGVAFDGVWLTAPRPVLEARIEARRGDASDATADTLAQQLARDPGDIHWRIIDASDPAATAQRITGGD
jgi:aminoglycoside phosphotransferase family enzyme/predicted kinase